MGEILRVQLLSYIFMNAIWVVHVAARLQELILSSQNEGYLNKRNIMNMLSHVFVFHFDCFGCISITCASCEWIICLSSVTFSGGNAIPIVGNIWRTKIRQLLRDTNKLLTFLSDVFQTLPGWCPRRPEITLSREVMIFGIRQNASVSVAILKQIHKWVDTNQTSSWSERITTPYNMPFNSYDNILKRCSLKNAHSILLLSRGKLQPVHLNPFEDSRKWPVVHRHVNKCWQKSDSHGWKWE